MFVCVFRNKVNRHTLKVDYMNEKEDSFGLLSFGVNENKSKVLFGMKYHIKSVLWFLIAQRSKTTCTFNSEKLSLVKINNHFHNS